MYRVGYFLSGVAGSDWYQVGLHGSVTLPYEGCVRFTLVRNMMRQQSVVSGHLVVRCSRSRRIPHGYSQQSAVYLQCASKQNWAHVDFADFGEPSNEAKIVQTE
jgi:hypothetical protein